MGFKQKLKKLYAKLFPQYKKLLYLEQRINAIEKNINVYQTRNQNMLWLLLGSESCGLTIEDAQKRFWINYPKAIGDLRTIQRANLYLISELIKICNDLGISFWMHGGSLIGAIRHQGFIPWDDDVDVGMRRKDLLILMEYLKTDEKYTISISYHDDGTFSRAYQFKMRDVEFPCFIDIFIFDYYSGTHDNYEKAFHGERGKMVNEFLELPVKPKPDYIAWHMASYDPEKHRAIAEIIDKHLKNINGYQDNGEYLYYSIENYPFPYPLMKCDDIFPLVSVPFENIEVNIPSNFKKYLVGYGDYLQIPKDIGKPAHLYYYEPHIQYMEDFLMKKVEGELR